MAAGIGKEKSKLPIVIALCLLSLSMPLTSAAKNYKYSDVLDQLKRLNKPPLKSIQSPDGDIIDCVPAANQPAFDDPLLKDHVIQMRPSCEPEGLYGDNRGNASVVQMWHDTNESCPDGTVAIRRKKEEDLLKATSLAEFGRKKGKGAPRLNTTDDPALPATANNRHEYAVAGVQGRSYYGAKATVSVWQPRVQVQKADEFSLSQVWITAGSYKLNDLNTIEAGWQVYPNMYGNSRPRLFTYWTRDAYRRTGCYNHVCPGFVQVSKKVAVGAALSPVSLYGRTQYAITILVWKDRKTRNWWLKVGNENVGYWPSSLFTRLGRGATQVQWGGEIVNTRTGGRHTTTQMGSGHFAGEGAGRASFFKNLQTVDGTNTLRNINRFSVIVDHPKCYNMKYGTSVASGTFFYYGGPGRNRNCP